MKKNTGMKNAVRSIFKSLDKNLTKKDYFLSEELFKKAIIKERIRSERNFNRLVIVNVDFAKTLNSIDYSRSTDKDISDKLLVVIQNLAGTIRETDYIGWLKIHECIGILFTDTKDGHEILLEKKIRNCINEQNFVGNETDLDIVSAVFPVHTAGENPGIVKAFYPEIKKVNSILNATLKRSIDIIGSMSALIAFFPIFVIVIFLIKITSPGPAIFCQQRIGKNGKEFTMYKFRSMYYGTDDEIHRAYVSKLIQGEISENQKTYKIVKDPRITPFGNFIRKTSIDELPQFINVFLGSMSLVGPRPPLLYETTQYQAWHLRRLYGMPGITGFWQVKGRSATTFDEMVRMDLNYMRKQNVSNDLKLILQTILVLVTTKGGY